MNLKLTQRRWISLALGAAIGCLTVTSSGHQALSQTPESGGTLRVSLSSSPLVLDPPLTGSVSDWIPTSLIYSNLTRVDETFRVQPDLAESWEFGDRGKTWTFKIRNGVKFHSGREVTADDVAHSIGRIIDPNVKSRGRGGIGPIEKIEVIDPSTVRFSLARPIADFPANLALPYARISPKDTKLNLATEADGTGPFILKEFIAGEKVVLDRNPNYFVKNAPHVDQVVLAVYTDSAAELNALKEGKVDIMYQVRPEQVEQLKGEKNITVSEIATGSFIPIVMRSDQPPFNDARVRKALKLTVDRDAMVKNVLFGHGTVANDQSLPPFNPFFNADVKPLKRDVAAAKKLLAEAGYPNGLKATLFTSDGRPGKLPQAVLLQQMAKEAGFDIQLQSVPYDVFLTTIWEKKNFYVNNWFARPTTDTSILPFFSTRDKGGSLNDYFYSNDEVDQLLLHAQGELDDNKRKALYHKAQQIISEDGPAIIAFFRNNITASRANVQNYVVDPGVNLNIARVWLKK
jgi:peptide/nickel transport system substrate-binding protein